MVVPRAVTFASEHGSAVTGVGDVDGTREDEGRDGGGAILPAIAGALLEDVGVGLAEALLQRLLHSPFDEARLLDDLCVHHLRSLQRCLGTRMPYTPPRTS